MLHSVTGMVHYHYTNLNVLLLHSVTGMLCYHYTNLNVLMLHSVTVGNGTWSVYRMLTETVVL